jgi:transposase-like protein
VADYSALKEQAIELRGQGYSLAQIARRLGMQTGTIGRWVAHVPFTTHNDESRQEQLAGFRDPNTYERARELRRSGWSYSMITEELGVNQSTLSGWLRDVEIEDHSIIEGRIRDGRASSARTLTAKHQAHVESVREAARAEISDMFADGVTKRELFLTGLLLYWGEGTKTGNMAIFANSDPLMIKTYMSWLRQCLQVDDSNIRAMVFCYPDTNIEQSELYWSQITNIPIEQFYKAQVDERSNKSADNQGKLKHGTLNIRIAGEGSSNWHQKILTWIATLGIMLDK